MINSIAAGNRSSEQSFSYYVASSVFDTKPQWALDFIRKNWGGQMKSPFFNGAWHECWDIEHFLTDLMTTSHAWCSGPTALLPQKVLGVEPISEGWKSFSVRPNLCDLKWAKGVVSTSFGPIAAEWHLDPNGNFNLYLKVPENTTATIAVPGNDPKKIRINDQPFTNLPESKSSAIKNERVTFNVTGGEYRIVLSK